MSEPNSRTMSERLEAVERDLEVLRRRLTMLLDDFATRQQSEGDEARFWAKQAS